MSLDAYMYLGMLIYMPRYAQLLSFSCLFLCCYLHGMSFFSLVHVDEVETALLRSCLSDDDKHTLCALRKQILSSKLFFIDFTQKWLPKNLFFNTPDVFFKGMPLVTTLKLKCSSVRWSKEGKKHYNHLFQMVLRKIQKIRKLGYLSSLKVVDLTETDFFYDEVGRSQLEDMGFLVVVPQLFMPRVQAKVSNEHHCSIYLRWKFSGCEKTRKRSKTI